MWQCAPVRPAGDNMASWVIHMALMLLSVLSSQGKRDQQLYCSGESPRPRRPAMSGPSLTELTLVTTELPAHNQEHWERKGMRCDAHCRLFGGQTAAR